MKKINVLILFLCSCLLITGCNGDKDNTKDPINEQNKNSIVFEDDIREDIIVRNHNVALYDNIYHVYMNIENANNTSITYKSVKVSYYKDTALIYSTEEQVGTINPHDMIDISFEIDINLINANRVEYAFIK